MSRQSEPFGGPEPIPFFSLLIILLATNDGWMCVHNVAQSLVRKDASGGMVRVN